jgi:zinc/manganese transport system substrate-binding protein
VPRWRFAFLVLLAFATAALLGGCGEAGSASVAGRLNVVAAEDFWGSIAAQLGGDRVRVTSVITNPAADPHDYEPTAADARAFASAQVAIVNGIGYDEWASNLLEASPDSGRAELDVGDLLGLSDGDNPHQWYSPTAVHRVIAQVTADFREADPGHASYYEAQRRRFETRGLARYDALVSEIRARYRGVPVGASESIVEPLAAALGLDLLTPRGFIDAVSEGTEPTPAEKATADRQIAARQIRVWLYNSQNATPDVQRLNDDARAAGIPSVTLSETTTPAGARFQDWMVRQMEALRAALGRGRA